MQSVIPEQIHMKKNTETEVKLYTPDLDSIEKRLLFLGARQIQERTHEFNLRFDHPELRLTEKRVVLRLRQDSTINAYV